MSNKDVNGDSQAGESSIAPNTRFEDLRHDNHSPKPSAYVDSGVEIVETHRDMTMRRFVTTDVRLREKLRRSRFVKRNWVPNWFQLLGLIIGIAGTIVGAVTLDPAKAYLGSWLLGAHLQAQLWLLAIISILVAGWMLQKMIAIRRNPAEALDGPDSLADELLEGAEISYHSIPPTTGEA